MKKATRLIIEEGNSIIFIKRTKKINGSVSTFYVLPGGILDDEETWEEAGIREAKEELGVDIVIETLFTEEFSEDLNKLERFYFAKVKSGKVHQGLGEEFQNMSAADQQAFMGTFENLDLFFAWYNQAKAEYEAANPPIDVGDGSVDIGDLID